MNQNPTADQQAMARDVILFVHRGYTVESQTPHQAVLVRPGTKVNHILHLLLSLLTVGLWLVMWLLIALFHKRTKRMVLTIVDDAPALPRGMAPAAYLKPTPAQLPAGDAA